MYKDIQANICLRKFVDKNIFGHSFVSYFFMNVTLCIVAILVLPLLSTLHVDHGVLPHQVNARNLDISRIQKQMIPCHISFIQQQITIQCHLHQQHFEITRLNFYKFRHFLHSKTDDLCLQSLPYLFQSATAS